MPRVPMTSAMPERDDRDRDDLDELQADVVDLGEPRREHEIEGDQQQEPHVDASLGDPVEDLVAAARAGRGQLSGRHRRRPRVPLIAARRGAGAQLERARRRAAAPPPAGRCRDQPEHAVLGDLGAGQRPDDRAIAQHEDLSEPSTTSSSSEEMRTTARPGFGQIADQALDLGLRADVDAARRIVEEQHPGLEAQDARQQDLLLIAAGQLADPLVGTRRLDPQAAHQAPRRGRPACGRETKPAREMVGSAASTMFSRTDKVGMIPSALRSSGMRAMPAEMAARGDPGLTGSPADLDRAAVERLRAVDRLGGLGPAGSKQAGEPDHLTGARLDRHVIEHVASRQAGRSEQRLRSPASVSCDPNRVRGSSDLGQLATEHLRDELEPGDLRDRSGVDAAPVAKHGHDVAQSEDLVESVRDIDDRHAVARRRSTTSISRSTSRGSSEEVGSSMMTTR